MTRKERQEKNFEIFYEHLLKYIEEFNDSNPLVRYICQDGYRLGQHVRYYRLAYQSCILKKKIKASGAKITNEQVEKLKDIGFVFSSYDSSKYTFYQQVKKRYNCKKKDKKNGIKNKKRQWNPNFNIFIKKLLSYKKEFGSCDVPMKYKTFDGYCLGAMVSRFRQAYKRDVLGYSSLKEIMAITEDQIKILKNIGFNFIVRKRDFQKFYNELLVFKQKYDSVDVPSRYVTSTGYKLGQTVRQYREAYKKCILNIDTYNNRLISLDEVSKLEDMGFQFILTPEQKRKNKGVNIPKKGFIYGIYQISLQRWIYTGQTIDFEKRKKEHFNLGQNNEKNKKLYQAMREYGVDDFEMVLLETCKYAEIDQREAYWTDKLDTIKNGYQVLAPKVIY